jgi:peptide/nickel transport system substrate-binding protein
MYAAGTLLADRYRLEQRLGTGGMGEVWRSTDEVLGRTVAIKIMLPNLTEDPGFTARFLHEARIMASVRHPGVVAVHDFRNDGSAAMLVMEFVEGEPLSAILRRAGRLAPAHALSVIAEAADALQAAHVKGIVHRDVKPANLLVRPDGSVVIIDFGIAASDAVTRLTAAGTVMGTAAWMSPEQAAGQAATPASDIYALGVVAYECLAGRRPFEGEHPHSILLKHLHEEPPTLTGDIPPAAVDLVARALAKEPPDRWPSAADLAAAARAGYGHGAPSSSSSSSPPAPEPTPMVVGPPGAPTIRLPGGPRRAAAVVAAVLAVTVATVLVANQLPTWSRDGTSALVPVDPATPGSGSGAGASGDSSSWAGCDADPNGCNSGEPVDGGRLAWAVGQELAGWNVRASGSTAALYQIMSAVAPSAGTFLPDGSWQWNLDLLAEAPAVTREDPQTWVYRIRPEATWSDGTDITADDFRFVWKHSAGDGALCTSCTSGAPGYRQIDSVVGSEGGKTVTVRLKPGRRNAEWRYLFDHLYPSHLATHQGFDLDTPEGVQAASDWFAQTVPAWSGGPWRIVEADQTRLVTLEPNASWYGETAPSLHTIGIRVITNPQRLRSALVNGEIDGAGPIRPPGLDKDLVDSIGGVDGVTGHIGFRGFWEHLDLNAANTWLADVQLRRAILTAVDVAELVEDTIGEIAPGAVPRRNHLFPNDSPYFEDVIGPTGQGSGDPDRALAMLRDAGYTFDGTSLNKDGQPVGPFRLVYTEGNRLRAAMAEAVQSDLAEIGIELQAGTTDSLGETLEAGDFDLILYAWGGGPTTFQGSARQYWHSESSDNFGSYQNSDVDHLVTEEGEQSDLDEAARLANEAAAIVAADAYVLPISDQPVYMLMSGRFVNVRPNHALPGVFYNTQEWGLASPAGQ